MLDQSRKRVDHRRGNTGNGACRDSTRCLWTNGSDTAATFPERGTLHYRSARPATPGALNWSGRMWSSASVGSCSILYGVTSAHHPGSGLCCEWMPGEATRKFHATRHKGALLSDNTMTSSWASAQMSWCMHSTSAPKILWRKREAEHLRSVDTGNYLPADEKSQITLQTMEMMGIHRAYSSTVETGQGNWNLHLPSTPGQYKVFKLKLFA